MGKLLIAAMLTLALTGCDTLVEKKSSNTPPTTPPTQQNKPSLFPTPTTPMTPTTPPTSPEKSPNQQ